MKGIPYAKCQIDKYGPNVTVLIESDGSRNKKPYINPNRSVFVYLKFRAGNVEGK